MLSGSNCNFVLRGPLETVAAVSDYWICLRLNNRGRHAGRVIRRRSRNILHTGTQAWTRDPPPLKKKHLSPVSSFLRRLKWLILEEGTRQIFWDYRQRWGRWLLCFAVVHPSQEGKCTIWQTEGPDLWQNVAKTTATTTTKRFSFFLYACCQALFFFIFSNVDDSCLVGPPILSCFSFSSFFFLFWLSLSTLPHRMTALWAALFFFFFSNLVRSPNYPPTSPWWIPRENCDITATWNQRRAMLKPHRCSSETKGSIKSSCCTHQNPRFSSSNYLHSVFVSFLFPCLNKKGRETKARLDFRS